MFLIYINDICAVITHGTPFLFADDIKIVYTFRNVDLLDKTSHFCEDLRRLESWSEAQLISFSAAKSCVIAFRCLIPQGVIKLGNSEISVRSTVRDLGISYSNSLNFSEHIENQLAKAKRTLSYIFYSVRLPLARLELYKLCVRPILEYCALIYTHVRKCDRLALESFQRAFTKKIIGYSTTMSYKDRCQELQLQPLWLRRLQLNLQLFHSLLTGRSYSARALPKWHRELNYPLRNKRDSVSIPQARTNLRKNAFVVKYSSIWNKLPHFLRDAKTPAQFLGGLQKFLNLGNLKKILHLNVDDSLLVEDGLDHI